jgi:hypothetical protein
MSEYHGYSDVCENIATGCNEAITHLASAGSDESYRTLIAAGQSRIYASNDHTGNWRVLADGLGGSDVDGCNTCTGRRFRSSQLGNYIMFTNDFDPVMAWKFGDPPTGLNLWSAHNVDDLLVIGITRARAITTFNGFLIIGNVDIEGEHKGSRIYWSDYNAPLSWIPNDQSLANFHEFALGEQILRIEPLGKFLFVYTDRALYQGVFVDNPDLVFQFNQIPTDNPLRYEHSLVNTGNAHIYMANNGIYVVTPSDPRPRRYEWMHKSDAAAYVGIGSDILGGFAGLSPFGPLNQGACEQVVGGYNQMTEEVWFSWPTDDNECPNMSLVLSLRYEAADIVDHGFTAFTNYRPDYRPNLRDWLSAQGVCIATASDYIKEGQPSPIPTGDPPDWLFNEQEDPSFPLDPDSWCSRLGNTTTAGLCDVCEGVPIFVMADAEDFTIKQYDEDTLFRERYVSESGTYVQDPYCTMLQSDMSNWQLDTEKNLKQVLADYDALEQEPASDLMCDVAYAAQPRCSTWKQLGARQLKCLTEFSEAEHTTNNTRPDLAAKWPTYSRGRYIGFRLWIDDTGGGCCFSRAVLTMTQSQGRTHR